MKNVIIFSVCMLCASVNLLAQPQQKFTIQNGTKMVFYDDLETAVQQAASGDTIYLPGGLFQLQSELIINKKLAIFGTGWDTGTMGGISITQIQNDIRFAEGSSGSLLTGCNISGNINFESNLQNITILRNRISGNINFTSGKQMVVSENWVASSIGIYGDTSDECQINNNYSRSIINFSNSRIYNNVTEFATNLYGCTVENNFIMNESDADISSCSNCYFNNNAFEGNITFPVGTNIGNNNLMDQSMADTFNGTEQPKDLEIQDSSPCKNAGTDGTDIGIYGGINPWKPDELPFNPHIIQVVIPTQADKDGNLKVNISVAAQTR
ncbi:MAG: hypothetical protein FWF53_09295 [Candidatus Azobacteroides sp.]|nr:hypothetical protein [Candidatus Azobacteroides sp.]